MTPTDLPRATASSVQVDANHLCSALCAVLDYRAFACSTEARRLARGHVTGARLEWDEKARVHARASMALGALMYHDARAATAREMLDQSITGPLDVAVLEIAATLELYADALDPGEHLVDVYLLAAGILSGWGGRQQLLRQARELSESPLDVS